MKKILITGGAGFIGSHLALKLVNSQYKVRVLDNLLPQIHGEQPLTTSPLFKSIKDKVEFILGDVRNKADWERALDGQQIVVHLAAETGTGQSMYEIERYTSVNIQGTSLLLDILANQQPHSIKKVVVASSRAIYGEGRYLAKGKEFVYPSQRRNEDMASGNFNVKYPGYDSLELIATDEESKIHPSSVYGITKQVQEQLVMTVCKAVGIGSTALRYQNVYGVGQSLQNAYTGILSIFSNLILCGKPINIFEDGLESRDFIYISDVIDATIRAIENQSSNGEVFNVGTGVATSVLTVVQKLSNAFNKEVPVKVTGQFRIGDIRHNYADIYKIKKYLGFSPTITFNEGVELFARWVQEQELPFNQYEDSLNEMRKRGLLNGQ